MEGLVGRVLRRSGGGGSGDGVVGGGEECRVGESVDKVSGGGVVEGKGDDGGVMSASVGDAVFMSAGARLECDSMGEVESNRIGVVFDGDGQRKCYNFGMENDLQKIRHP
ncbi:hypothetical protein ACFX2C_017168 [Malus domestica]